MSAEQWQNLDINVGDELEFEVFRLDSDAAGVFCIRGKLNITRLVCQKTPLLCYIPDFLFFLRSDVSGNNAGFNGRWPKFSESNQNLETVF
jgi:hypothetical protein